MHAFNQELGKKTPFLTNIRRKIGKKNLIRINSVQIEKLSHNDVCHVIINCSTTPNYSLKERPITFMSNSFKTKDKEI